MRRPEAYVDDRLPTIAATAPPAHRLRRTLIAAAALIAAGTLLAHAVAMTFLPGDRPLFVWLTSYFFRSQDAFWLAAIAVFLMVLAVLPLPAAMPAFSLRPGRQRLVIAGLAVMVFAVGVLGARLVFDDYPLARDEILADFDATIFRTGAFVAPVAPEWRAVAGALQPRFMLPIADGGGFVSAYLPVNAALRALVGIFADADWTSPLLAVAALFAVVGIAHKTWPERPDAACVVAILVASSSQVLVTAMTGYAMTAHLALNAIWLWLYLRDDRVGHAAALGIGFLATGLHQVIFHPVFAAPFVLRLWTQGQRKAALVYGVGYAAICLFWISYWKLALGGSSLSLQADDAGPLYFIVRTLVLLTDFQAAGGDLMLKNLLRFIAWQSPALVPLALLAVPAIRRGDGIARCLAAGIALTLALMFILLPYQGHGWGYRYLHGLIGNAALLGGFGWIALTKDAMPDSRRAAGAMLTACTAVALFALLPGHVMQARGFARPYREASRIIADAPTDLVFVDKSRLLFGEDVVRNDPFLRNRPKVIDITYLTDADIVRLCSTHTISIFDERHAVPLGIPSNTDATASSDAVRQQHRDLMTSLRCGASLGER